MGFRGLMLIGLLCLAACHTIQKTAHRSTTEYRSSIRIYPQGDFRIGADGAYTGRADSVITEAGSERKTKAWQHQPSIVPYLGAGVLIIGMLWLILDGLSPSKN